MDVVSEAVLRLVMFYQGEKRETGEDRPSVWKIWVGLEFLSPNPVILTRSKPSWAVLVLEERVYCPGGLVSVEV